MNKHRSSERNTPLALTIGLLLIISVFAMSSCSKKKTNESQESTPPLADSSITTAENSDETGTTSLTGESSDASGESTDSSSASDTEEPTESFTDSALFDPSDPTASSGAETTPGTGSSGETSKDPSADPTKAPSKATATPKPKATATPKPKATATPAPKENTPTPVPKENTPTPKPQPKPSGDASSSGAEEFLNLVNAERASKGAPALTLDSSINAAARTRSIELAENFSHTRPNKERGISIIAPYGAAGECIAAGPDSISSVFNEWKNSSKHFESMTNPKYTKMGIGYVTISGTRYWCLLLKKDL